MKWFWYVLIVVIVAAGGWWLWQVLNKPAPGTKIADLGRQHVSPEVVAQTTYNSNPPTSGPHLPTWVKAGIYTEPQNEGELIHSLEHGYVIISYNCGAHLRADNKTGKSNNLTILRPYRLIVSAHEEGSPSGDLNLPKEATGSAINDSEGCRNLIEQLNALASKKRLWKLIVVPRPRLDTTLALTAWNYLDKFDQFATDRIEKFIDYHRDHGPEQTME